MNYSVLYILLIPILLFSCKKEKNRSKTLLGQNSFSKTNKAYILVENDSFIVSTTLEKLKDVFKPWISKENNISEDKELYNDIIKQDSANPVFVNRIAEPWKYERRLIYKIADLFETGNCLVFNKMTQHVEDRIIIKEYQSPVGYDGRKFYIGEIVIFKTMDRIY